MMNSAAIAISKEERELIVNAEGDTYSESYNIMPMGTADEDYRLHILAQSHDMQQEQQQQLHHQLHQQQLQQQMQQQLQERQQQHQRLQLQPIMHGEKDGSGSSSSSSSSSSQSLGSCEDTAGIKAEKKGKNGKVRRKFKISYCLFSA
jgi:transcription initiation factor TFIID subunit TAF12